jgi:hypothetical protein
MPLSPIASNTPVFLDYFKHIDDPRQAAKILYPIKEILLLVLCAVISGADNWTSMVLSQSLTGGFYSGPSWNMLLQRTAGGEPFMTIDFKGAHYPKAVIVYAVFSMSVMPCLIVILKRYWPSVVCPSITRP